MIAMSKKKLNERQRRCLRRISWDYNIEVDDISAVINGEKEYAGHWNFDRIFLRMLERLRWYDLLELLGRKSIQEKLVPPIINQIRSAEKRKKYERLGKILRGEPVSFTKWSLKYRDEIKDSLFSNRWYSA